MNEDARGASRATAAGRPARPVLDGAELDDGGRGDADGQPGLLRRLSLLPRPSTSTLRRAGLAALALSTLGALAAGALGIAHAVLSAPPAAFAVFEEPAGNATDEVLTADERVLEQQLRERGTIVVEGPHLLDVDGRRLGVYREWLDDSRTEVCATVIVQGLWPVHTACTSEAGFRADGLDGVIDTGGYRLDFRWSPDGAASISITIEGVRTLDELRALEIPAIQLFESAPPIDPQLARDRMLPGDGVVLGPIDLGEREGMRVSAFITSGDAFGSLPGDDRLQVCLAAGDRQSTSSTCEYPTAFVESGLTLQIDAETVIRWLPNGDLLWERP